MPIEVEGVVTVNLVKRSEFDVMFGGLALL